MSANRSGHTVYLDVRTGEELAIAGGRIKIRVEDKSGKLARLRLEFVERTEVTKVQPGMARFAREGVGPVGGR